jgi:hypothetical protein
MQYFLDRLKEPGTLRSLAVVLFALLGIVPDDALLQSVVSVGILVLGGWSALMPEKSAQAAVTALDAAGKALDAAASVDRAAAGVSAMVRAVRK